MSRNIPRRRSKINGPLVLFVCIAVAIVAALLLTACKPVTPNGDATPQPGHTTIVGPSPSPSTSARASIIPNPSPRPYVSPSDQAQADALKNEHPTVLCNDGYLGWPTVRRGACSHHQGVSKWYGVNNA
jgi:hypothetical protein